MSFVYVFAGITVHSDFAISGLRQGAVEALTSNFGVLNVRHAQEPRPNPDSILFAWPGRYATRLGLVGEDWLVDSAMDGVFRIDPSFSDIKVYSESDPPSAACMDVLVRRVLPRLMVARGALTIHAATVAIDGAAIALLGRSGAGKSTMTGALAAMPGWDMFSDDQSILWEGTPTLAMPSAAGVCLWQNSTDALGLNPADCMPMPGYDRKFRFHPRNATPLASAPLRAFVFLDRQQSTMQPTLSRCNRAEALILAAQQLIRFNPASPNATERANGIAKLSRIASAVEMLRLSYPSRFDALPDVANLLQESVGL